MQVTKITPHGNASQVEVNTKFLTKKFDMHVRDLRPVFLQRQLFTVSVRGKGIVVNLGIIKIIIGSTESFLLNTGNEKASKNFCAQMLQKLEEQKKHHDDTTTIPFEFLLLEEAFIVVLAKIHIYFETFSPQLDILLKTLTDNPTQSNFEELLVLKKEISGMEKTVQELQNAVEEVLDDDDEMKDIILSANTVPSFEADDAESVLENILEQIMEIAHKIVEKKENIDDTQEILTLQMASIRNTIIQFDLIASIGTSILAVGTLVTGFYGMNLNNQTQHHPYMFFIIVGSVLMISSLSLFSLWKYMRKKKILSF